MSRQVVRFPGPAEGRWVVRRDVVFRVDGEPRPKGSMNRFMRQSSKRVRGWQQLVGLVGRTKITEPHDGPVAVEVVFDFAAPERSKLGYPGRQVGDVDKLLRAVLDGLSGVAYHDDSQVVLAEALKDFGRRSGAWIRVVSLDPRWTTKGLCRRVR